MIGWISMPRRAAARRLTAAPIVRPGGAAGQVLPLFALMLVVLLGFMALAIDVSNAYADLRFYRASADSAALAGAQDLQTPGSRAVGAADYVRARQHALASLESQLGATSPSGCDATADIVDCALPGTPYLVSIKTPSPSCATCDPSRAVQVTIRHPNYRLSFARLLGSDAWNLGITSVAGLEYGGQYAVMTLRPPKKLGSTFDVKDIVLNGTGTTVRVLNGDVGTNANMELNGTGSAMILDPGFKVYHFDNPPLWVGPPAEKKLPKLIADPNYQYPSFAGAPTFTNASTAPARTRADLDPSCAAEAAKLDPTRYTFMVGRPLDKIYCYNPGIYDSSNNNARIKDNTGEVTILKPGAYYLKRGLDIGSYLVGGYEAGKPGVAIVFDECANVQCNFNGNNALVIALNVGTAFPPGTTGTYAAPAIDWAGNQVVTSGPTSPTPPLMMTLLVVKDPSCYVPTSPPWQEPSSCDASKNLTLNMAGGGRLALAGVQYAPTDNVTISGGSAGAGDVGQIIAWTLKYDGGTTINQHYPGATGNGILRIDAACSGPGEPCSP
jgi:Flp pilus assembly protein TadG